MEMLGALELACVEADKRGDADWLEFSYPWSLSRPPTPLLAIQALWHGSADIGLHELCLVEVPPTLPCNRDEGIR